MRKKACCKTFVLQQAFSMLKSFKFPFRNYFPRNPYNIAGKTIALPYSIVVDELCDNPQLGAFITDYSPIGRTQKAAVRVAWAAFPNHNGGRHKSRKAS